MLREALVNTDYQGLQRLVIQVSGSPALPEG